MRNRLLETIAQKHRVPVEKLRTQTERKWEALGELCLFPHKEQFSLKIWEEAVSYLLGCEICFKDYEEIGRSLKPFSLTVKGVSSS